MATEIQHHNCPLCGPSAYNAESINHVLHLMITLFSCGLWAFVWIALVMFKSKPRCGTCGLEHYAALRQSRKSDRSAEKEAQRLKYNAVGPQPGTRAKVTRGKHAGKFGSVIQNDGSRVTISDKAGKTMTLPLSDFSI